MLNQFILHVVLRPIHSWQMISHHLSSRTSVGLAKVTVQVFED